MAATLFACFIGLLADSNAEAQASHCGFCVGSTPQDARGIKLHLAVIGGSS